MSPAATPQQSGKRRGPVPGGLAQRLWPELEPLAAREQGVTIAEVRALDESLSPKQVHSVLAYLRQRGHLFAATITHKRKTLHTTPEAARAREAATVRIRERSRHNSAGRIAANNAPWPADAPMVITPQTRHTIAPTPPRALKTNTHSQF